MKNCLTQLTGHGKIPIQLSTQVEKKEKTEEDFDVWPSDCVHMQLTYAFKSLLKPNLNTYKFCLMMECYYAH